MNVTASKSGRVVEVVVDVVLVLVVVVAVVPAPLVEVVELVVVVLTTQLSQRSPVQLQGQRQTNPLPERMHSPPFKHGFGSQKFVEHTSPHAPSVPI